MGEAKLKRRAEAQETVVRQALSAVSTIAASSFPSVQFLVLDCKRTEEARARLGGLPANLEVQLSKYHDGGELPGGALWWRTPEGFEQTVALSTVGADSHQRLLEFVQVGAISRGYGWRLANFLSEAFGKQVDRAKASAEQELMQFCSEVAGEPPLRYASLPDMECFEVQQSEDPDRWARQASLLIRAFDGLSASRRLFESKYGAVSVSFAGHHHDPREIFEIEQGATVIRRVVAAVGHWRWFLRPEEAVMWTGALFATGKACVNSKRETCFPVDTEAAVESMQHESFCISNVATALGINDESKEFTERGAQVVNTLFSVLRMLENRQRALAEGRETLMTDAELVKQAQEQESSKNKLKDVCTVLDRSDLGKIGLRMLLESTEAFPPAHVKDALRSWQSGTAPMVMVRKHSATGQVWGVESLSDSDAALIRAVDSLLLDAVKRKESLAWQLLVTTEMRTKLSAMTAPSMQRLMKAAGVSAQIVSPGTHTSH